MISSQIPNNSPFGRAIAATKTAVTVFSILICRASLGNLLNVARHRLPREFVLARMQLAMVMVLLVVAGCNKVKSTDVLIGDLSSTKDADRIKAVRWLQHRSGDVAKVVPALIASLKDEDIDVRWSAAIGLGYFGAEAKSALPALKKAKDDKDKRVRNAASVAISRIEGKNEPSKP
jgi:hypothetical protein